MSKFVFDGDRYYEATINGEYDCLPTETCADCDAVGPCTDGGLSKVVDGGDVPVVLADGHVVLAASAHDGEAICAGCERKRDALAAMKVIDAEVTDEGDYADTVDVTVEIHGEQYEITVEYGVVPWQRGSHDACGNMPNEVYIDSAIPWDAATTIPANLVPDRTSFGDIITGDVVRAVRRASSRC